MRGADWAPRVRISDAVASGEDAAMKGVLCGLALLLGACAGVGPQAAPRTCQALDSETNGCLRFPANCPGGEAEVMAARQRLAEAGANVASIAAGLCKLSDEHRAQSDAAILD